MARQPRFIIPNYPQHIIQRGNNRCTIFQAEGDYYYYLEKLLEASEKHECKIHAYVLMTNHVHLLATPLREDSFSKMQQLIGRYYVPYFNRRYHRTGTLWEGRYRATLIENEKYFLACMRYIESNPVRANMVDSPVFYPWSSYHANALGKHNPLIHFHEQYLSLGNSNKNRQTAYQQLFELPINQQIISDINEATNKAWVLGGKSFKQDIVQKCSRQVAPVPRGGDRKSELFKK